MFAVYHVDKYTKILLALKSSEAEAISYIEKVYAGRFDVQQDNVVVVDDKGNEVYKVGVRYNPMYEAVRTWHAPSSSSSKIYEQRLTTLDMLTCNCKGWTFKKAGKARSCKHIDDIIRKERFDVQARGQYLYVVNKKLQQAKAAIKKTPQAIFAKLIEAYEKAIDYMSSLDPADMLKAAPAVEEAKFKVEVYMTKLEELGIDGMEDYNRAQAKLREAVR